MTTTDGALPFAAVAQPANRTGRPDRFFHFLIGYLAPTLYALTDAQLDGPLGVRSVHVTP